MLTSSFSFPSTNFHKLYYLKRPLFRLKNYHDLSRIFLVANSITVLDLKKFRILVQSRKFLREYVILMDSVNICILFGINQPPDSLKITSATFLIRETLVIAPTNLLKQVSTYSSLFKGHFI